MILVLEFCPWGFCFLGWLSDSASPTRKMLNCENSAAPNIGLHPDKSRTPERQGPFPLCPTAPSTHSSRGRGPSCCQAKWGVEANRWLLCHLLQFSPLPWEVASWTKGWRPRGLDNSPRTRRHSFMEPMEASEFWHKRGSGVTTMLNEHWETYPRAAFASFAFSNGAFSHILQGGYMCHYFPFVSGVACGRQMAVRIEPLRPTLGQSLASCGASQDWIPGLIPKLRLTSWWAENLFKCSWGFVLFCFCISFKLI